LGILILAVGLVGGGIITYAVARNVPNRPRLVINLSQVAAFSLADLGIQDVTLQHGPTQLPNLCVLELTIRNKGLRLLPKRGGDIKVDFSDPKPRIDFTDFEILGHPMFLNSHPGYYIPVAKSGGNKRAYINVKRIAVGVTAQIRMVGVRDDHTQPLTSDRVNFFPGALHNVDVVGEDLLLRPIFSADTAEPSRRALLRDSLHSHLSL